MPDLNIVGTMVDVEELVLTIEDVTEITGTMVDVDELILTLEV